MFQPELVKSISLFWLPSRSIVIRGSHRYDVCIDFLFADENAIIAVEFSQFFVKLYIESV